MQEFTETDIAQFVFEKRMQSKYGMNNFDKDHLGEYKSSVVQWSWAAFIEGGIYGVNRYKELNNVRS